MRPGELPPGTPAPAAALLLHTAPPLYLQAALVHATGHSLHALGLAPPGEGEVEALSFDGEYGLNARLRNAEHRLGRAFCLQQTEITLDTALRASAGERFLIFCYHGHAEDVSCAYDAYEVALRSAPVERLEALFFRLQLEMVGHYVVVDSNLGIIYTEPEVHIVTPEQRRNPALLHELFLQPPFQLIFDRSPTARHRTRLLSLRVRTPGAADSNYAHRAMFARPQGPLARLTAA